MTLLHCTWFWFDAIKRQVFLSSWLWSLIRISTVNIHSHMVSLRRQIKSEPRPSWLGSVSVSSKSPIQLVKSSMTGVVAYSNSLVRASELRVLSSVFTWSSEFFLGFLVLEFFFVQKNIHIFYFRRSIPVPSLWSPPGEVRRLLSRPVLVLGTPRNWGHSRSNCELQDIKKSYGWLGTRGHRNFFMVCSFNLTN